MGNFASREKRGLEDVGVPERRPSKRPRLGGDAWALALALAFASNAVVHHASNDGASLDEESTIALPPEAWAMVLDHLDYQSVLSCAATSRAMLHDAMPLVKMLHIDRTVGMNAALASRFRDVRVINLYWLLRQPGNAQ